jgi:tRNA(Ile2) C34 agmatinyltransferase TiaS
MCINIGACTSSESEHCEVCGHHTNMHGYSNLFCCSTCGHNDDSNETENDVSYNIHMYVYMCI